MGYLTFLAEAETWRIFDGPGVGGPVAAEIASPFRLLDFSASRTAALWVCGEGNGEWMVRRAELPTLSFKPVPWLAGRIGAIAVSMDGSGAAALNLPVETHGRVRMFLWTNGDWQAVDDAPTPHISSKLAWLENGAIVYEAEDRRLTVYDPASGRSASGPEGCCPEGVPDEGGWYGICAVRVMVFPSGEPFHDPPSQPVGFDFGPVTRVRSTCDGRYCTWTESAPVKRLKGYYQERGGARRRFREIDLAAGAILGPY